ncbi:MAG: ABC transporter permease subunit [Pseudomonadota bacterium]
MTFTIAVNELRGFSRNGVFVALAVAMLALSIAAAALSIQRMATFERERAAAEQTDREVFLNQGERNPHSAAHFSRYAFKPIPALASFDPGITDYAGIALWMEAHYQNPAVFRRAEDLGDAGRFADLSPAWILQYAAPLFLFLILFAAIAGEREQGTLRQMLASGVTARNLAFGKLLGAAVGVLLIVAPAMLIGLVVAGLGAGVALPDTATRVFGLVLTYAAFLLAVGGIALGISAFAREKRTALLALVAVWAAAFVFLPRMAATLALAVHPLPDATALSEALSDASRTFSRDDAAQAQMEEDLLSEYGVDNLAELPFNFGGYRLQYSEEYAHPLFEAFYRDVDNVYRRQQ